MTASAPRPRHRVASCCHPSGWSSRTTSRFPLGHKGKVPGADVRGWASENAACAPFKAPCLVISGAVWASASALSAQPGCGTRPGAWTALGARRGTRSFLEGEQVQKKGNFLQSWPAPINAHFQLPAKKDGDLAFYFQLHFASAQQSIVRQGSDLLFLLTKTSNLH